MSRIEMVESYVCANGVDEKNALIERLSADSVALDKIIRVVNMWERDDADLVWYMLAFAEISTLIDERGD